MATLAQNTGVCGCRPRLYYSKVNIGDYKGSWSLGWESWITFPHSLAIFRKASPHFGGKWTSFVPILAQKTCVYGCRLVLYLFKYNISLLLRFMKPGMGIMVKISSPTSPFSAKPALILEENGLVLWLLWPKTHVCMVLDWNYTSFNSILVYYQGSWRPGW